MQNVCTWAIMSQSISFGLEGITIQKTSWLIILRHKQQGCDEVPSYGSALKWWWSCFLLFSTSFFPSWLSLSFFHFLLNIPLNYASAAVIPNENEICDHQPLISQLSNFPFWISILPFQFQLWPCPVHFVSWSHCPEWVACMVLKGLTLFETSREWCPACLMEASAFSL